jgi:general secretion pathway protein G
MSTIRSEMTGVANMETTIVLLAFMVCSVPMDKGRAITTEANLRLLENTVRSFKETSGRLPTREEDLSVLIEKPSDWPKAIEWTPFLETTELPRDGWNHDFVYVLNPNLPHGFGVYSCGQDGVTTSHGNDRDDINTWNAKTPWRIYYELPPAIGDHCAMLVIIGLILAAVVLIVVEGFPRARRPAQ